MKILIISSRVPYPAVRGDQVILLNRLRHLAMHHEITLLTFYQHERELQHLERVRPFCVRLEAVKISRFESIAKLLLSGAFSGLPLQTLYFRSHKFDRRFRQLIHSGDFDLIHAYLLRMAEYTRFVDKPKVLDLIDCMQLNLEKRVDLLRGPQKWLYEEELRRIKRYERAALADYDGSIVVSDTDKDYLMSEGTVTIPLGIDTDRYRRKSPLPDNRTIIFSGRMAYQPNESAVIWFLRHCFDTIRREVPDVKLKIVGIDPGNAVRKYHDGKAVFVTGFVDSMVDELAAAQVAIAPMQSGYGMHIKILEAMACGLPVVATASAKGTIAAEHGVHLMMADDAPLFVEACITLLKDRTYAESIGRNARALIMRQYSWESSVSALEQLYGTVVGKRKGNRKGIIRNFTEKRG